MKQVNLISIISAHRSLDQELFGSYLRYSSIHIKTREVSDLEVFVNHLKTVRASIDIFDKYFVGFTIPQIGKEFDLLRLDSTSVVNIELKNASSVDKIKNQLIRNRYYLSFLSREIFNYSYISSTKTLYFLNKENDLRQTTIEDLLSILRAQDAKWISDIENYFDPSNYLVSPFNSTQEFIDGKFFLTTHQEEIKKKILSEFSTRDYSIISITGKAGTGKTLLTYDIAKSIMSASNTLIVHCGLLNGGHNKLREEHGWLIIPAKDLLNHNLSTYKYIIVDEAQRIYPNQLSLIINLSKENSINCIFSYDGLQTLRRGEISNRISERIEGELTLKAFELTSKIRTNKEVASFIQCLFEKTRLMEKYRFESINVNYFESSQDAKNYLLRLRSEQCKVINYTPSSKVLLPYEEHNLSSESDNAHTVIGQEFNHVVAVIDEFFYYDNGRLSTRNYKVRPYYHPTKMLFQIVSRTRRNLSLVIIRNPEVFRRCLDILNQ